MVTKLTNQVDDHSFIPSTDVIQLTLTLKMATTQVVKTSATVNNSPIQYYVNADDPISPTHDLLLLKNEVCSCTEYKIIFNWLIYVLYQYVPEELLPVYRDQIIPQADIITPNQFEAE